MTPEHEQEPDDTGEPGPIAPATPREGAVGMASLAGGVLTVTLLAWHGPWHEPAWWMTAPFVAVWCFVPYAWVMRELRAARHHEAGARLCTAGAVVMIGLAAWVLWRYHFTPGERGGRVFLMLPIWQGLGFAPLALLARWLRPAQA